LSISACFRIQISAREAVLSFRDAPDRPYWINREGGILEIPLWRGVFGMAAGKDSVRSYDAEQNSRKARMKLGILARLGLFERTTLTPEGVGVAPQRRLVRSLLRNGHRIFTLCYHSSSLAPGNTPYVRDQRDLGVFLDSIRYMLDLFLDDLGGRTTTALEIRDLALAGAGAWAADGTDPRNPV